MNREPEVEAESAAIPGEREYETLDLVRNYTDEEKANLGKDLAKVLGEIDEIQQDLKSYAAEKKARLETLAGQKLFLVLAINRGNRWAKVECRVMKDFILRTKTIVRLDTGEIVEVKPLTLEEMQGRLKMWEVGGDGPHMEEGGEDS